MDVSAVSSVNVTQSGQPNSAQTPVAQNEAKDVVEISSAAKALQAQSAPSDADHDGDKK